MLLLLLLYWLTEYLRYGASLQTLEKFSRVPLRHCQPGAWSLVQCQCTVGQIL